MMLFAGVLMAATCLTIADRPPALDRASTTGRADQGFDPNPYPGGSPFPPGKEPSLTHEVRVYWTTAGGRRTMVDVVCEGPSQRPTQTDVFRVEPRKDKPSCTAAGIHPGCDHHFAFVPNADQRLEKFTNIVGEGEGTLVVRVYGFKAEDFTQPPKVTVRYFSGDALLGQTTVTAQPAPKKPGPQTASAPSPG